MNILELMNTNDACIQKMQIILPYCGSKDIIYC